MNTRYETARLDYKIIVDLITPQASILDLGCGDGELLSLLAHEKSTRGQGIEIDEQAIYDCVARGLNVLHGDIDTGLSEYRDKAFDYVIMNESLQQIRHIEEVLTDALRVGQKVIIGFPNFAYYKARFQIAFFGKAPVAGSLPYAWYSTPNLHFLSILDFIDYCSHRGITIESSHYLDNNKRVRLFPNFFATTAIFMLSS